MSIGAVMTIAQEMRRRRDERGRYMDGGYNDDVRPRNRSDTQQPRMRMGDDADMKHVERDPDRRPYNRMGGVGGFVWDRMPPISPSMGDDEDDEEPRSRRPDDWPRGRTDNITSMHDYAQTRGTHHGAEKRMIGFQQGSNEKKHLTRQQAEAWVDQMRTKDGKPGKRWSFEEIKQYAGNYGVTGEQNIIDFYVVMNMMYSDYCHVAKKLGVDKMDFYVDMTKAFLNDPDAGEGKLTKYKEYIVED